MSAKTSRMLPPHVQTQGTIFSIVFIFNCHFFWIWLYTMQDNNQEGASENKDDDAQRKLDVISDDVELI